MLFTPDCEKGLDYSKLKCECNTCKFPHTTKQTNDFSSLCHMSGAKSKQDLSTTHLGESWTSPKAPHMLLNACMHVLSNIQVQVCNSNTLCMWLRYVCLQLLSLEPVEAPPSILNALVHRWGTHLCWHWAEWALPWHNVRNRGVHH